MLGCLLGAYMVSITLGLVVVFALPQSSAVSATRNTFSPALDLALGTIALCVAIVLGSGLHEKVMTRRDQRKSGPKLRLKRGVEIRARPR